MAEIAQKKPRPKNNLRRTLAYRYAYPSLSTGHFNYWFANPVTCALAIKYRELAVLEGFTRERVEQTRRLLGVSWEDLAIMCGMSRAQLKSLLSDAKPVRWNKEPRLNSMASACCYYLEKLHVYETLYGNAPKL